MIIAIDGPAAAGKGTLARRIAEHFGFAYLDTGKIYRATALRVLAAGRDPAKPEAARQAAISIGPADLEDPRLLDEDVARPAPLVAAHPQVPPPFLAFHRPFPPP